MFRPDYGLAKAASRTRSPDGTGFHPDGWMDVVKD